jgi:hypothetical protein
MKRTAAIAAYDWGVPLLAFSDFLKVVVNYTFFLENKK